MLAGGIYAVLVLIMWMPLSLYSGMPFETAFPYMSETSSVLGGFLYPADPLRLHTNTFYHLSYLIAEALGIGGSYVPFQVVHALLWWARGFLSFMLFRRFFPGCLTLCYVAGALVIVHASDGAMQWIGQMNQFGFIFWMLLAFYLLSVAVDVTRPAAAALLTLAACGAEYMSLWSYESQILMLLAFPLVLLVHRHRRRLRLAVISPLWYSVPAFYIWLTIEKYRLAAGQTYQQTVLRKSWAVSGLLADWIFNIVASLQFWAWPREPHAEIDGRVALLALLAAAAFIGGGAVVVRLTHENRRPNLLALRAHTWWTALALGLVLSALSFPVYIMLDSARGLWRTQFLSGIGSGLILTALIGLACSYPRVVPQALRVAVFLGLGGVIVGCGSFAATRRGAFERSLWERHRAAIAAILHAAPRVRPNTVVVLLNVPKNDDPFGHSMWLDLALRLVYPGIPVAGTYFYDDHTPAPGDSLEADGERWTWNRTGFPSLVRDAPIANTVIVDYAPRDGGSLLKTMPPFLCHTRCDVELYNPAVLISGTVSSRAARRYRLSSDTVHLSSGGISVREATYGQNCSGAAVPAGMTNTVTRGNFTRTVARACGEQDVCDFTITIEVLGDPAPLCAKDFHIRWTCPDGRSAENTVPPEALGKTVHISCYPAQLP